jgi:hypothetical protein
MEKMKTRVKLMAGLALVAWIGAIVVAVAAPQLVPLGVEEKAQYGATHVLEAKFDDFAAWTTTNTSCTITSAIPIGSFIEFRLLKLDSAFDNALTNTFSMTVIAGTALDDDLFLASTELAKDGTEILTAVKRADEWTATMTATGSLASIGATIAATDYGDLYCTAATNILTKFTPSYSHMLSSNTVGKVRMYWRIFRYNE